MAREEEGERGRREEGGMVQCTKTLASTDEVSLRLCVCVRVCVCA